MAGTRTVSSLGVLLSGVARASSISCCTCIYLYTSHEGSFLWKHFHAHPLSYIQFHYTFHLEVSILDFLAVFAARTHGILFSCCLSVILVCAAVFSTSTSTLLSWLWLFFDMEHNPGPQKKPKLSFMLLDCPQVDA